LPDDTGGVARNEIGGLRFEGFTFILTLFLHVLRILQQERIHMGGGQPGTLRPKIRL